jgi:hypothetical protein
MNINCAGKLAVICSLCLSVNIQFEVIALQTITVIQPFLYTVAVGVFWIFLIWVLWKIVQSLKCAATSLKEIAVALKNKN